MRLIKFKARNFKNLERVDIDFDNINLINGDNGSGKSSILQGIQLLLTGSLPEKLSEYINWNSESFSLELDFEVKGKLYNYKYKYDGGSTKELTSGLEFYKSQDAVKHLDSIINSELLLYSSMSEQGQSYSILQESPSKRLERFKSILGIDRLSKVVELSKTQLKTKENESALLKRDIDNLKGKTFNYLDLISLPDISSIKKELDFQDRERIIYEDNIKTLIKYENDLANYKKVQERKIAVESFISLINSKLESYTLVNYNPSIYQSLSLQKQEQTLKLREYDFQYKAYTSYVNDKESYEKSIQELESRKSQCRLSRISPLEFAETDIKDLETLRIDKRLKLKEVENHLSLVDKGQCPTCGQTFSSSKQDLLTLQKSLTDEIVSLTDKVNLMSNSLSEFKKATEENNNKKERLSNLEKDVERYNEKLSSLIEVKKPDTIEIDNTLDEKIKEQIELKNKFDKQEVELKSMKDEVLKFQGELESLISAIEPIQPDYKSNDYNDNRYQELKKELNIYDQKVQELKRIEDHNEKIRDEEKRNKQDIKDKEAIYYTVLGEIKSLEEARNILDKQFGSYLIEKGTSYVESKMNEFFQKCYPKYNVLFKQTDNKKSIDFYYTNNDSGKIASAALCSGFEKQLLAMAFRIALSSITGVGFLILDEVDSDASTDNSINLYSNLVDSNLFSQIIAISHKEETKQYLINQYNAKLVNLGEN